MIKKVLLSVVLFGLIHFNSIAQAKPGYEETVKWISEKINLFGDAAGVAEYSDTKTLVKYGNIVIKDTKVYDYYKLENVDGGEYEIPLAEITAFRYYKSPSGWVFELRSKRKKILVFGNSAALARILMVDFDNDMVLRFSKALSRLVELNTQDDAKETF